MRKIIVTAIIATAILTAIALPPARVASFTFQTGSITTEELRVSAIVEAMVFIESGGHGCHAVGLSGERGCMQFMPSTWRAYSTEALGHVAPMTEASEIDVSSFMVRKWLSMGMSERDIFLTWNQGNPGACSSGVNGHGVRFDSCAYADRAEALYREFMHMTTSD